MKRERGDGGLFRIKGSKNYYAQIYKDGRPYRVTTGTPIKEEAKEFLRKLQADASAGKPFVGETKKVTYGDLRAGLLANYTEKGNKSLLVNSEGEEFVNGLDSLDEYFGFADRKPGISVTRISTDSARAFAAHRLKQGVTNSTVNNSLSLLRRMLKIAYEDGKIPVVPVVRLLKPNPARKGFVSQQQFDTLHSHLAVHLQPLATFLYWCAAADSVKPSGSRGIRST
jgi:integrase family protein with SAM-like domain